MQALKAAYVKVREARGQTLAEYALILGLIAVVAIAGVTLLGTDISTLLKNLAADL